MGLNVHGALGKRATSVMPEGPSFSKGFVIAVHTQTHISSYLVQVTVTSLAVCVHVYVCVCLYLISFLSQSRDSVHTLEHLGFAK